LQQNRAPQPLDAGVVPGSVGRTSPSVMPATGAPRRKNNQVSRDKPDIMLLSNPLCLHMDSNAEAGMPT